MEQRSSPQPSVSLKQTQRQITGHMHNVRLLSDCLWFQPPARQLCPTADTKALRGVTWPVMTARHATRHTPHAFFTFQRGNCTETPGSGRQHSYFQPSETTRLSVLFLRLLRRILGYYFQVCNRCFFQYRFTIHQARPCSTLFRVN